MSRGGTIVIKERDAAANFNTALGSLSSSTSSGEPYFSPDTKPEEKKVSVAEMSCKILYLSADSTVINIHRNADLTTTGLK